MAKIEFKMDTLSREHYLKVWSEMQGRFFSQEEADSLSREIEKRVITDPEMRVVCAQSWKYAKPE